MRKEIAGSAENIYQKSKKSRPVKLKFRPYLPAIFSFLLLALGLAADFLIVEFFRGWVRLLWYVIAYLPVGLPVMNQGMLSIARGDFFTEFFLMSIATIGAFAIGEYPEGVAVMLFYTVGELFQDAAVARAKTNIKALLDVRPDIASVWRQNSWKTLHPEEVEIGEKIQVKSGEKVPLDGLLLSEEAQFNTAALTGESTPVVLQKGEKVLSGSINVSGLAEIETTHSFKDSSVARIIDMVQNASARKSKTELFIRKFARVYTPVVVYLAIAVVLLPYFFVEDYVFEEWLYRALIFLVISCPCALVISIPLGYFGGLGAASKNGILFKGASFLDRITKITTLVLDKTGTLTHGVFKVREIRPHKMEKAEFMQYLVALERKSTHPIAQAIVEHSGEEKGLQAKAVKEIPGKGIVGEIREKKILAGNLTLLEEFGVEYPEELNEVVESIVVLVIDKKYSGYVVVADELKKDARQGILGLKKAGFREIIMLSGDNELITGKIAADLGITSAKGGLLPEDKLREVENLQKDPGRVVAFVGDGINDAPVLAVSDVGIAMGALGSDVAIETADVVIQTDQPSKILQGIKIGQATRNIVWQNIALAFGVKAAVLILGTIGLATLWQAVFADVGVAFLAILNAIRLQRKKF